MHVDSANITTQREGGSIKYNVITANIRVFTYSDKQTIKTIEKINSLISELDVYYNKQKQKTKRKYTKHKKNKVGRPKKSKKK